MLVVLNTNVLVSALWSRGGNPSQVLSLAINGHILPCHDYRILAEYREVLRRPRFDFQEWEIADLLTNIENSGISVVAPPLALPFADEDDKKFYEVAKHCGAKLITGNKKHFPLDDIVISAADFLAEFTY
jgi:putative PIN family toxin of toxin-antitoxin system